MTTTTQTASPTTRRFGASPLTALREALRPRDDQRSERRAAARAIAAYPASRSAAFVILPAHSDRAA